MVDAYPPAGTLPVVLGGLIESADDLIIRVEKVDAASATILKIARAKLFAYKANLGGASARPVLQPCELIRRTDDLILQAERVDTVAATLLKLARAELVAHRAAEAGEVARFDRRPSRTASA